MATSIPATAPLWGDGLTYAAQALRQADVTAFYPAIGGAGPLVVAGGVTPGLSDTPLRVSPSSGMTVAVAAGWALVQGTATADAGAYRVGLTAAGTLDIPAAHASLARRDLIVARVTDNGDSTSAGAIAVVQGTPAGSPADPSLPPNALVLARVTVPAGATSITAANLTDLRMFAVPAGGVQPATSGTAITAPHAGQVRHDTDTGQMRVWDGAAWQQVGAVAAPRGMIGYGYNNVNSAAWTSSTEVQVQVVGSVAMVSGRKYKITSHVRIGNGGGANTAGDFVILRHKIDGTSKGSTSFLTGSAVSGLAPDCFTYSTLVDDATTGTHTVSLTAANLSGSGSHQLLAAAPADRCWLAVEDIGAAV